LVHDDGPSCPALCLARVNKWNKCDMSDPLPRVLDPNLTVSPGGEASLEGYGSADGTLTTGTWTHPGGQLAIDAATYDEVCVLLEGHVRLTGQSGYTAEFKAGETFVIPRGFKGTWETIEPVRKHYIIYEPGQR
jgi:uncharacterized cupin superfamily protein